MATEPEATATTETAATETAAQAEAPLPSVVPELATTGADAADAASPASVLSRPAPPDAAEPPVFASSYVLPNGVASPVPRLRTAWKRKQDPAGSPPPGKPAARPATKPPAGRAPARPGPNGVRAHLPAPPRPASPSKPAPPLAASPVAPPVPLPALAMPALPPPPPRFHPRMGGSPITRVAPVSPVAPQAMRSSPKARPRGSTRTAPGGTIVAPAERQQPGRGQRWFGNILIALGILVAVGAVGGTLLFQRAQQGEQEEFAAQFGVTAPPGTIAAVGNGPGAALPPATRPGGLPPTRAAPPVVIGAAPADATAVRAAARATNTSFPGTLPDGAVPDTSLTPTANVATRAAQPVETTTRSSPPPALAGGALPPAARLTATAEAALMPVAARRTGPLPTATPRAGMPVGAMPSPQAMPPAMPEPMGTPVPPPMPMVPMMPPMASMATAAPEPTPEPEPTPLPMPEPKPRMPVPLKVAIPVIGVSANVIEVGVSPTEVDGQEVYVWDVASYAAGHHFSSASPGEGENVVLSGHDDWEGEVFRDLWRLKKGAKITITTSGGVWNYYVDEIKLLKEVGVPLEQRLNNAQYIGAMGEERLTLITCWPYGVDDHRLVVIARPGP